MGVGEGVGVAAAPLILLLLLFGGGCLGVGATPLVTGDLQTNELVEYPAQQEENDLPYCRAGAACGYVQVNAYGVNTKPFCKCGRKAGECPLHWDPQDGRSVTMGSDQYKFCGSPPPLHMCDRDETSYSAAFIFTKATFSLAGERHLLHCYCPPPFAHTQQDMVEEVVDGELIMATLHSCSRLTTCTSETPCKEVSLVGEVALVTPKCRCPRMTSCPTLSPSVTPHANTYQQGTAYSVFCNSHY